MIYANYGVDAIATSPRSSVGNPYLFTGRTTDLIHDSGDPAISLALQDNRARTYNPHHGRWLQRDPIGYADGTNLYQYVMSGPHYFLDPSGEVWVVMDGRGKGSRIRRVKNGRWFSKKAFKEMYESGIVTDLEWSAATMALAQEGINRAASAVMAWVGGSAISGFKNVVTYKSIFQICTSGAKKGSPAANTNGWLSRLSNNNVFGGISGIAHVQAPTDLYSVFEAASMPGIPLAWRFTAESDLFFSVRCNVPEPVIRWTIRPKVTITLPGVGLSEKRTGGVIDSGDITEANVICACCLQ